MNRELATLQGLLNLVDDARMCQRRVARDLTEEPARRLLERAAQVHLEVGSELADHIVKHGGRPRRSGSVAGSLRAVYSKWLARISFDHEAASLMEAAKCETRVLRRFRGSVANVRDAELQYRMRDHQRQIELVYLKISQLGFLMEMRTTPGGRRTFVRPRLATRTPAP
jgi:uncharacterized protein (TIGR02284 family)